MKTDTLAILAAAGLGLFLVAKMTRPKGTANTAQTLNAGGNVAMPSTIRELFNDDTPGQAGYAWRYFSDGTSIGPDGSYYQGSTKVWSPT